MADKVQSSEPLNIAGDDISKEYAIRFLDINIEDDVVFIARNLRITQVGLEAKVIGKIVDGQHSELEPFTVYYNGKFIAEELIDGE